MWRMNSNRVQAMMRQIAVMIHKARTRDGGEGERKERSDFDVKKGGKSASKGDDGGVKKKKRVTMGACRMRSRI